MEELAASLHISYDRFRHLCKEQTGLSPYQYHLQARILRAQEMLQSTQLSIRYGDAILRHTSASMDRILGRQPS